MQPSTAAAPHPHPGLRERLVAAAGLEHPPAFEPVDPDEPEGMVLRAAAALAAEAGLSELDIDREPTANSLWSGLATASHCSVHGVDDADETHRLCSNWSPVGPRDDPRTGFGDGPDSALLGHFPRHIMPDDWRTDALLLVVTSPFVHVSVDRRHRPPLVRGALQDGLTGHRYVELS